MEYNPADIEAKDFLTNPQQGHFTMDLKTSSFIERLQKTMAGFFIQTKIAMELLLLTFVRTSELRKPVGKKLILEKKAQWIIPGEQMKMGRDHCPIIKSSFAL